MNRRTFLTTLANSAFPSLLVSGAGEMRAVPGVFYASRSGRVALDEDAEGGNPFASSLIQLLGRPVLSVSTLRMDIVTLTLRKSRGLQRPDVSYAAHAPDWQVKPIPARPRRIALVFVYSRYRDPRTPSLPGAQWDLRRVRDSLASAGFAVTALQDPSEPDLLRALRGIRVASRDAEAAVIYATGHAFEHRGEAFLVPNDQSLRLSTSRLVDVSVHVGSLADHLHAARANLVFFGGCRTRR